MDQIRRDKLCCCSDSPGKAHKDVYQSEPLLTSSGPRASWATTMGISLRASIYAAGFDLDKPNLDCFTLTSKDRLPQAQLLTR